MTLGAGFLLGLTAAILSLKKSFFAELILPFNLYGSGIVIFLLSRTNLIEPKSSMMRNYNSNIFLVFYIFFTLSLPVTWRSGIVLRYPFGAGVVIYNVVQRKIWGDPVVFETNFITNLIVITFIEGVVYINLKSQAHLFK